MKMNTTFSIIAALTATSGLSQAAVTLAHEYHLGEAGSLSGPSLLPQDSVGTAHVPNLNVTPTVSVTSTGLAAPGSTAALQIVQTGGGFGTYFGTSLGQTNNWALEIWLRPDSAGGTFLGATDGNGTNANGLQFHATNSSHSETSLCGNALAAGSTYLLMRNGAGALGSSTSTYTTGTWAQVNLINYNGTVHYYLDGVLQDSATTSGVLDDYRLGAGYNAGAASNGAFDEMKVYTFDNNVDSLASVEAASISTVPEPSSTALLGLGGLALILRRRK